MQLSKSEIERRLKQWKRHLPLLRPGTSAHIHAVEMIQKYEAMLKPAAPPQGEEVTP